MLWLRGSTLVAQRYDAERLQLSGEVEPVAEPVGEANGRVLAATAGGVLLFTGQPGNKDQFTWFDRAGKGAKAFGQQGNFGPFRLSPDGKRVAASRASGSGTDLWMAEVEREAWSRFTFLSRFNAFAVWSPNGSQVLFQAGVPGNLYWKNSDGGGTEQRLTESANRQFRPWVDK